MNLNRRLTALAATMLWCVPAYSQEENLETLIENSQAAMKAMQWEQALSLQTEAEDRYGRNDPLRTYGAQFGTLYYQMGVCEMKLKRWSAATRSFEICYRDFPDDFAVSGAGNPYQVLALCKWGEAAMALENWELAESLFAKFVEERNKTRDLFPQGSFYVNVAICQYKLGRIDEGNENLEIAIQNKTNFPTPESGIIAGFQALVDAAVKARDEQVVLDFITKNRGAITLDAPEDPRYAGVFLKLAGDALTADMPRVALALYPCVPTSLAAKSGADSPEGIRLAAIALIHETNGNLRGACAAYQQLVLYHPDSANREQHLYQLIRTASLIGESGLALQFSRRLYQEFPESAHLTELRAMDFDFTDAPAAGLPTLIPLATGRVVPESPGFAAALDLYQGRKYEDALAAFRTIKSTRPTERETAVFAAFHEMECLRKLGDLEGLANALREFEVHPALGGQRLQQLEIYGFWDAVRKEDWKRVTQLAEGWTSTCLPGAQRAQVAYCQGLAMEKLGHPIAALNAYNTAMTADAGASEQIARQAVLHVLRIHQTDPEVRAAMAAWGNPAEDREAPGCLRLREAAAVAALYDLSLGASAPLPAEFREFLKYQGKNR